MMRILVLLLALFSLTAFLPSRSAPQESERPAACTQWDRIPIPPGDLPTPQERESLAGCDSEELYFGIGRPADPAKARKCAYLEREGGDAPIFNGPSLLIMIYANGKGAARNFDLALKFACEFEEMPGMSQVRIDHLLNLRDTQWSGDNFSLCDDGGTFMQGACAQLRERINAVERTGKLDKIVARWSPIEKAALAELQKAANNFFQASTDNEVDTTGTGRASFLTDWRAWLDDSFVAAVERCEKGQLPDLSPAEFQAADRQLNAAYSEIEVAKPDEVNQMGTVTPAGVRTTERAWLAYREAWVKFGAVKYPHVGPESWRAWLTYNRVLMLRSLPGTEPSAGEAFEPYVPWRYHYELGQTLGGEDGVKEIREAIRLKPDWAEPHNALGETLAAEGDRDGAIREYRETLRLDPTYSSAHNSLGEALTAKGDWDGAVKEYREVVHLYPDRSDSHDLLGKALVNKKDWDGAVAELREAIRLKPDDSYAHGYLAWSLANKKDWDNAIKEYAEAVRLRPDAQAHGNLGWAYENVNDWDKAAKERAEAVRLEPSEASRHGALGWALENNKDIDGAIREYREALRLKPDWAEAYRNLGWALYTKGDLDDAVTADHESIRLKANDPQTHYNLAYTLKKEGDVEGAIAEFRETIRLQPDAARPHHDLGAELEGKGDDQSALEEYRKAQELEPKNPDFRDAFARLAEKAKK